jgi:superfamily II DNA/RNA helicase
MKYSNIRGRSNTKRSSFAGRNSGRFARPQQQFKKHGRYQWSEEDLVRLIEFNQKNVYQKVEEHYVPKNDFASLEIDARLKQNIFARGYSQMTPIQDQAINEILYGKDIIGIANTGTGKTAAFLIPLINKLITQHYQRALIIAPTRELAAQIFKEFKEFSRGINLQSALIIGGANIRYQIQDLRRNPSIVIGTPGRIQDLINKRLLELHKFNNVVLDETDRMVDIGFLKEIKQIISMLPTKRQSLFFSATVSDKVQDILNSFVTNPKTISVKTTDTNANIEQKIIKINRDQKKVDTLHQLLKQNEFEKVIVFGNTKWGIQKLTDELVRRGIRADAIHGDKRQTQRHKILERFKRSEIQVLLATDVAARGLDIKNISHVINYEMPLTSDDYIHRIGRTGRANNTGIALTLLD